VFSATQTEKDLVRADTRQLAPRGSRATHLPESIANVGTGKKVPCSNRIIGFNGIIDVESGHQTLDWSRAQVRKSKVRCPSVRFLGKNRRMHRDSTSTASQFHLCCPRERAW